jgi:hypothetical protein
VVARLFLLYLRRLERRRHDGAEPGSTGEPAGENR